MASSPAVRLPPAPSAEQLSRLLDDKAALSRYLGHIDRMVERYMAKGDFMACEALSQRRASVLEDVKSLRLRRTQRAFLAERDQLDANKTGVLSSLEALWKERGARVEADISRSGGQVASAVARWAREEEERFAVRCRAITSWGREYARAVKHTGGEGGEGVADLEIDFEAAIAEEEEEEGEGGGGDQENGGAWNGDGGAGFDWSRLEGLDDSELRRGLSDSINMSFSGIQSPEGTKGGADASVNNGNNASVSIAGDLTDVTDVVRPPGRVIELRVRVHRLATQRRFREAAVAKAQLGQLVANETRLALLRERERHAEAMARIKERQCEARASLEKENEALREAHEAAREAAFEEVARKYQKDLRALEDRFQIKVRRQDLSPIAKTPTRVLQQQQQQQQRTPYGSARAATKARTPGGN